MLPRVVRLLEIAFSDVKSFNGCSKEMITIIMIHNRLSHLQLS